MKTTATCFLLVSVVLVATAKAEVTFDWATVGNPGNGGIELSGLRPFGRVDYVYRISKHEVTNVQYTEFLNVADPTGANELALYSAGMSSSGVGGINFNSGAVNGSKYQLKPGRGNNPVIGVSFIDAMRFTNWLHNGQGYGSTETGAYTIATGDRALRNPGATYFIPSEHEWFKAAYHANDGVTANYHEFPFNEPLGNIFSDQPPGNDAPIPSVTANYYEVGYFTAGYNEGYAATGSSTLDNSQNYLTDVGAYSMSVSAYGTYDQAGNVSEWNEFLYAGSPTVRGVRGGFWGLGSEGLSFDFRVGGRANRDHGYIGFRVASIPEPSSLLLGLLGGLGVLGRRRR